MCVSCERDIEWFYKLKPTSGFDPRVIPDGDCGELRSIIDGGGKM